MITYKDAGVDIDKGNKLVETIRKLASSLNGRGVISSIGAFSGLVELADGNFVLSATTDGVGTKLIVAQMADKHDTVGIDLVAMNVNDIVATGSRPLFFLDYIAYSKLEDEVLRQIVEGIVEGLRQSSAYLLGGETAQMPDMYPDGAYDLAGFCVGLSRKDEIFDGDLLRGDTVIGVYSSGFHSNGYSLLRKLFFDLGGYTLDSLIEGQTLGEILLKPTVIYVRAVEAVRNYVHAAAHITGGGLLENVPRVLPEDKMVVIERRKLPQMPVFELVRDLGKLDENQMYRTFNMGVGFVLIVRNEDSERVVQLLRDSGYGASVIGFVEEDKRGVSFV